MADTGRASSGLLRQVHRLFCLGTVGGLTDGQLLDRFVAGRGEDSQAAFEELMHRHGPMVLRVCRGMLGDPPSVEDAFQATFLVLAQRARSIRRRDSVSSWLFGVARRVAAHARLGAARRRSGERLVAERTPEAYPPVERGDEREALLEEMERLPDRLRSVVVLCYLDGLTYDAAARRLGLSDGAVRGRLARARDQLRRRLTRRGVTVPAGLLAAGTMVQAQAAQPLHDTGSLVESTIRMALGFKAGTAAATLARGVLRSMFMSHLRAATVVILAAISTSLLAWQSLAARDDDRAREAPEPGPRTNSSKVEAVKSRAAAGEKVQEKPGRSLLVHVLGSDGAPMPGVSVHRGIWTRKPSKDRNRDYVSDDRGQVRMDFPEDIYIVRLWVRAKGLVPLFADWEEEDHPETSLPAEYTFRLGPGTVIGGVVRDGEGKPIKGATVEVMLSRGGRSEGYTRPDMWLAEQDPRSKRITVPITDEQGRWSLDNVPPGEDLDLRLKLSHPDFVSDPNWGTMQQEQGVELKALRSRTATITMRGGVVATGTVTDPQGKPIAGAVVVRGDRPYWEVGSQEVRTDEQGRYRLSPLPAGKVTITVVAQGWMPSLTKADIRQGMGPVDFRLQPGKELRVRIVDQGGKSIPGVAVQIKKWRGGESLYNHRHPNVLDTRIPFQADDAGLYRWTWAPDDAVTYQFYKEGYVYTEATLVASGSEQSFTLPKLLRISGKVTDRAGRPIKGVTAIPVDEFRPGHLIVERNGAKGPFDGSYAIEVLRTDVSHRVRIEAMGYRTAMSDAVKAGMPDPTFDFRLEEAAPVEGRVMDPEGHPVKEARVYLATASQNLNDWPDDPQLSSSSQKVLTDDQGRFTFPAQFERYAIVAIHDRGYAEVHLEPDQQPGELALKRWAQVEGQLVQAGQPVSSARIFFMPVRILNDTSPHIQDGMQVMTKPDGRFVFPRVPPVKSRVCADLSVWRDHPITSSQSVPLDLKPGERVRVDLGARGTVVKGRVVLSGDAVPKIDLHKSLNWLLRRVPGIEPPPEVRSSGLSARNGWDNAWRSTREGLALIETLHTYFVVLDRDGRFQIGGVPAGDYDLALTLYEPPGDGCLVSPVGSRIVRFRVTEDQARSAGLDLGEIPVKVAPGPRIGDPAPDFVAVTSSGETVRLSSLRGRYVLLDFWATWCGPCVAHLPELRRFHDTFGGERRVTVVGLNLDDDPARAREFVEARKLPWTQGFLDGRADDKDDVLSRYSISSIPTYILIGPDGRLIHRGDDLDLTAKTLRRELQ